MSRKLTDLEWWRPRVVAWLILTAVLIMLYWVGWFADHNIVASSHATGYVSFEQSFPLADAWLMSVALIAAIQLWYRRPSALVWLEMVGGIGLYLFAMDVLYDVGHSIYSRGSEGQIEFGINLFTVVSSVGVIGFGWRFRFELLRGFVDKDFKRRTKPMIQEAPEIRSLETAEPVHQDQNVISNSRV